MEVLVQSNWDEDAASRERMGSKIPVLRNRDSKRRQTRTTDEGFDALAFAKNAKLRLRPRDGAVESGPFCDAQVNNHESRITRN
jgi:hypothetical protein